MRKYHYIPVKPETTDQLDEYKQGEESWDNFIRRLTDLDEVSQPECPTAEEWFDPPEASYCPFCGAVVEATDTPTQYRCSNGGGTFYIE